MKVNTKTILIIVVVLAVIALAIWYVTSMGQKEEFTQVSDECRRLLINSSNDMRPQTSSSRREPVPNLIRVDVQSTVTGESNCTGKSQHRIYHFGTFIHNNEYFYVPLRVEILNCLPGTHDYFYRGFNKVLNNKRSRLNEYPIRLANISARVLGLYFDDFSNSRNSLFVKGAGFSKFMNPVVLSKLRIKELNAIKNDTDPLARCEKKVEKERQRLEAEDERERQRLEADAVKERQRREAKAEKERQRLEAEKRRKASQQIQRNVQGVGQGLGQGLSNVLSGLLNNLPSEGSGD